jgi:hypothetical protein
MFMVCFILNCCPCEKKEEKLGHVSRERLPSDDDDDDDDDMKKKVMIKPPPPPPMMKK